MEDQSPTYERIKRYLSAEMTPEEVVAFENDLNSDEELAELLENEKRFLAAIHFIARGTIDTKEIEAQKGQREMLLEVQRRFKSRGKVKKLIQYSVVAAAAALLVFLVVRQFTPSSNNNLYNEYYHPLSIHSPVIEKYAIPDSSLAGKFLDLYNRGAYKSYLDKMESNQTQINQLPSDSIYQKEIINLYAGICLMESNKHAEAVKILSSIDSTSSVYPAALWYSAMGCLKEGDDEGSSFVLNKLVNSQSEYQDSAKIMLKIISEQQ